MGKWTHRQKTIFNFTSVVWWCLFSFNFDNFNQKKIEELREGFEVIKYKEDDFEEDDFEEEEFDEEEFEEEFEDEDEDEDDDDWEIIE